ELSWRRGDGAQPLGKPRGSLFEAQIGHTEVLPPARRPPDSSLHPKRRRAPGICHGLSGQFACCIPGAVAIVAKGAMPARYLALAVVLILAFAGPASAQRGEAKKQVEFGVQVAERGLWREAIFRWERATQLDPTYAAAFNNLAVAYEQ